MSIIHISIVITVALLSILFGIRVLFSDQKNKANRFFAYFAIAMAIWIVLDFSLYQPSLSDFQTILNRLDLAIIETFLFIWAAFVIVFPRASYPLNKYLKIFTFTALIVMVLITLFTKFIVESAWMEGYGSNFAQGEFFYLFPIFSTVIALYSIILLIIKYRNSQEIEKKQIKYIGIGITVFFVLNIIFNLAMPMLTKNFEYGRFGSYSAIFFVGFTAYAILKTRMFNVKVILTEAAVVIINVISVVQIFTSHEIIEALLRTLFALLIFYGSYILLRSVKHEIKQKEELQLLSTQLTQANNHLKELDEMKTEFVSLASHELLTPVSAIEGYLSMILDEHMTKIEDPKTQKYLDNVYKSAKRLARLIADMLNISRIEEGRLSVEKQDVNLSGLINQVIDEVKFKAEERKQKIEFDPGADGWQTYGDSDKIKEVIINLVGNSIKYSRDPGTIRVEVKRVPKEMVVSTWDNIEAEIKARPLDDQEAITSAVDSHYSELVGSEQLLIMVKDQGVGIPREELSRLFKKFHRVGNYSTQESQGTGLGLYISRALVELQHGRIWADSEGVGKGSTFSFTVPDISAKTDIINLEKQIKIDKEQLKPLARPMKSAAEEL